MFVLQLVELGVDGEQHTFSHTSIADYDGALKIDPNYANSLYGRGIAKLKKGDNSGGNSDIESAKAIQPDIAEDFARYGVR